MATDIPMNTLEHVVYSGTELNALDVAGCNWRKPYSITIPAKPTGVAGITVARLASESNCDQLNTTSITTNGTVLYGDTLVARGSGETGYNDPTVSFTSGVTTGSGLGLGTPINALYFDTTSTPQLYSGSSSIFENNILIKVGEVTATTILNGEESIRAVPKGLCVVNDADPPRPELQWEDYTWTNMVVNFDTGTYTVDGVEYSFEQDADQLNTLLYGTSTVLYRQYTGNWSDKPTGWLVDKLVFDPPVTALEVNEQEQDIWGSYIASDASGSKVIGDVAVSVTAGRGKTYYVYYNKGTSTGGTLPTTTTRTYPNAATIATNNMTKSNTTANSYTVSYANGTATGGTLPATQTSVNTTTYTKNGWTTGASNYNDPDYANGASFGANSTTNLTLYPNFTTSTTNGGVTLSTNNMTKSNTTANSYTVTYAQGNASNTTNLPSKQTSINTTVYTKNGWTTTSGSTTQSYANGAKTGALTANKTLYPCFSQSTTNGGVTLSSNTMSKSATTEDGYKVTYAKGTATSTTVPGAQTIKNTRSYTHNGWATSANGSKTYNKGATTGALSQNLTLYPYFDSSVTKGTINLATNSMTKSNTEANSYTVTYANGTATSGTLPSTQTSKNTTTYTANGWTTSSSGYNDRDYANGASYGAGVTGDITLYPNFTTATTNGGVTLGTNNMSKSNTTANSYTVAYAQGNASSTTNLPATQTSVNTTTYTKNGWTTTSGSTTRTHANGAATGALTGNLTLYPCFSQSTTNGGVATSSNTMSKNNTTENGCTVTYAQGNASNTTNLPSKQTATNTRSYTHNGWATSASGAKAYSKGAATGALSKNLTLYPYFDSAISTYGSVTVSSNTMSKSSTTESGYTLTYNKGTATSTSVPSAQTATDTRSYTHSGWATSASGSKAYNKGASTGALSSSITLYPYFDSSVTRGSVTLATNSMTKSSTTDATYTVTYNYNGNGASNTTATATKTRSYTANGWTTTSGSTTRTYTNGQSIQLTSSITIYPCFSESTSTSSVTLPTPTRTGYTFKGWSTSSSATSGSTGSYTPTANVTLYAIWAGNTYTVTYAQGTATGGTLPATQSRTYPNAVTLATNSMTKSATTDTTYTVTFHYNGNGTANTTATAKKTRTYTADGWTKTSGSTTQAYANGATLSNADAKTAGNLTLYPCFKQSVSVASVTLPTPSRTGYAFKGWSTSPAATSGSTGSYTPTGNVTLYAVWEAASTSTSASITFPAVPRTTVRAYTQAAGSNNRIFTTGTQTEYSGYGAYTSCTIDGVDVTSSWLVTVKEESALLDTTIYKAKFTGGKLYVDTTAQGVGASTATSMILSANAYSTTATFTSGGGTKSLSQPNVYESSIEFSESNGYSQLEVILYNPNDVAVTAQIDFYDYDDVHYGSGSLQVPANDRASTFMDINSSSAFESGCYIEVILQAPNCNDSEVYVYEVSVI